MARVRRMKEKNTTKLSFEEKADAIEAMFDECKAAGARGDELLAFVPEDDVIVGELWGKFMKASDEFECARALDRDIDAVLAASTKMRDAVLACLRYTEAVAINPKQAIRGDVEAVERDLADKGFLVDSGRRDSAGKIIWIQRRGSAV
jgi:hypothetical protein